VYGYSTIYFFCAIIGVFTLIHIFARYTTPKTRTSGLLRKPIALFRYVAYKGYRIPALRYYSPGLGVLLLILAGIIYFSCLTFVPQPYYWPNTKKPMKSFGNSPPLATRTGWMALAVMPFTLAFGTKANFITTLTGVPHERLQVFHQWSAYLMFALALVHTFPFIVFHIWKGDMVKQWKSMVVYWTGVVAIIAQAWLTFMSFGRIRARFYEFFKATHIFASLVFLVFFFLHCDFRLSSW
jgi:hypothetical protein